jgi:hypothetical protein
MSRKTSQKLLKYLLLLNLPWLYSSEAWNSHVYVYQFTRLKWNTTDMSQSLNETKTAWKELEEELSLQLQQITDWTSQLERGNREINPEAKMALQRYSEWVISPNCSKKAYFCFLIVLCKKLKKRSTTSLNGLNRGY